MISFYSDMCLAELREKTFTCWPYSTGKCTAKQMAKAGFYLINARENIVACYFCFKELEGWEEDDDPFEEHKKHAPFCLYVNMFNEAPDCIKLSELILLEQSRIKRSLELKLKAVLAAIDEDTELLLKPLSRKRLKRN